MDDIRQGVCPLCRHNQIVEAEIVISTAQGAARVGVVPIHARGFVASFKRALHGGPSHVAGQLVAYACRACGYAQQFIAGCAQVPIGEQHGTRVIEGPAASSDPFR
jgi:hypothetical protein